MKFSERIGKKEPKNKIQINGMDQDLRNGLWNVLTIYIFDGILKFSTIEYSNYKGLITSIWLSFFKEPLDLIPYTSREIVSDLRKRYFNWDYLEVYDFLDFISKDDVPFEKEEFLNTCNIILEREVSGYRFINGILVPITNEQEKQTIENTLSKADKLGFEGVKKHLEEALIKLSDKKHPDYRNSIKESILAVESICQIITGKKGAELGKTLKLLKTKMPLHGALEQGFMKLYGYTSDSDGIRHAMLDADNLDQEDALYMLVTCSSFVNYLMIKAEKYNLI